MMHSSASKSFTVLSCVALTGVVMTIAPSARAACPEADPGAITYKNSKPITSACTATDFDAFETAASEPNATYKGVETALKAQSATCAACIFTNESDAAWGPIVYVGTTGSARVNFGSCFEKAPGGSATCGQTLFKADACFGDRCPIDPGVSCEDDAAQSACVQTVLTDANSCGQYDVDTACPNYADLNDACADLFSVARILCGGEPPADAGSPDAGSSDAGKADAGKADASTGSSGSSGKPGSSGSSGSSSSGSSGDDDSDSSGGTTSSSGGKKSSGGTASNDAGDTTTVTKTDSGCAESPSSSGSIASALVIAAAVGVSASRRRRTRR